MKKMMFGITLILFSIVLYMFDEKSHNDILTAIYVVLPFIGMAFSVWGFVEKDRKSD